MRQSWNPDISYYYIILNFCLAYMEILHKWMLRIHERWHHETHIICHTVNLILLLIPNYKIFYVFSLHVASRGISFLFLMSFVFFFYFFPLLRFLIPNAFPLSDDVTAKAIWQIQSNIYLVYGRKFHSFLYSWKDEEYQQV